MSPIHKKIQDDLTTGLKAGDSFLVSTLRFLLAEINNLKIAIYPPSVGGDLTDEDIISVLQKQVKSHRESIEMFEKGKRQDLVEKEKKELEILTSYLPKQMEEAEIRGIAEKAVSDTGAKTMADMGKVMGVVMPQVKGKAEGSTVSALVRKLLSK